ncbi:neutral zinc metallopeptidase [Propionibacteriaceae bacterium Y1923]
MVLAVALLVGALGFAAFVLTRDRAPSASTTPGGTTPITTPDVTTPQVTTPEVTTPVATPTGLAVLPQRSWDTLPGPNSTEAYWVQLQQNSLYPHPVPTFTCPEVPEVEFESETHFETFMSETIACQHAGWQTAFEAIGKPLVMPKVSFIRGAVQTPCGQGDTTFYCGTWDGEHTQIYVNYSTMDELAGFRQMPFFAAAHEFAHHVQHQSGLLWNGSALAHEGGIDDMERSRRIELQASCWTSRIMVTTDIGFNDSDYSQYIAWTERDLGEVHGSAKSNQYWWQRGFYMDQVSGCNTWTVTPDMVT